MKDNKSNIFETNTSKVWINEEGICIYIIKKGANVRLEDVKESTAIRKKLQEERKILKIPVLADISGIKSTDRKTREYGSSKELVEITKAMAILFSNQISKVFGNVFYKINKPPYPVKLFTDKKEAIKWLKGFIE